MTEPDEMESSTETESSDVTSRGVDDHDDDAEDEGFLDINDASLFGPSVSRSTSSFPSIRFGSTSQEGEDSPNPDTSSSSSSGTHHGVSTSPSHDGGRRGTTTPVAPHILYIQMVSLLIWLVPTPDCGPLANHRNLWRGRR